MEVLKNIYLDRRERESLGINEELALRELY